MSNRVDPYRGLSEAVLGTTPPAAPLQARQATVAAYDVGTGTVSLFLSGDLTQIDGVKVIGPDIPRVNDLVWLLRNGTDLLCLGNAGERRGGYYYAGHNVAVNIGTTFTSMTMTVEDEDPHLLHDASVNTSRMVANVDGVWLVSGWCFTGAQAAGGLNEGRINVVGTGPSNGLDNGRYRIPMNTAANNYFSITCPVLMDAGDYAEVQFLSSAGAVTVVTPFFHGSFTYLAPR